jgi:hypothetical protein
MGAGTHLVRCGVDLDLGDGFAPGWGEEEARGGGWWWCTGEGKTAQIPRTERERKELFTDPLLSLSLVPRLLAFQKRIFTIAGRGGRNDKMGESGIYGVRATTKLWCHPFLAY